MENNRSLIITIGVLLVLAAVVVALVMTRSGETVDLPDEEQNEEEFTSISGDEENSVIVNDQIPGSVVFYDNLNLSQDSFVVVRNEVDGEPGEIIGSAFVEAGSDLTGEVDLDENTTEGGQYYVELYEDVDENGVFNEEVDTALQTEEGNAIRVQITTTEDLPEIKG